MLKYQTLHRMALLIRSRPNVTVLRLSPVWKGLCSNTIETAILQVVKTCSVGTDSRFSSICSQCRIQQYRQMAGWNLPSASHHLAKGLSSTTSARVSPAQSKKPGFIKRILNKYGYSLKYRRFDMMRSGLRLYLCCAELVDTDVFFKEFDLPDTFNSWFTVVSLHIWMCMCRLKVEGAEGEYARNKMLINMWEDVSRKAKKLGPSSASLRNEGIQNLNASFRYSLVGYDEGIMDNDRVLAGAIWRHFFFKECDDPCKIETLVHYIHKQLKHLEQQESDIVVGSGLLTFLPLHGDKLNEERNQPVLEAIWKRT